MVKGRVSTCNSFSVLGRACQRKRAGVKRGLQRVRMRLRVVGRRFHGIVGVHFRTIVGHVFRVMERPTYLVRGHLSVVRTLFQFRANYFRRLPTHGFFGTGMQYRQRGSRARSVVFFRRIRSVRVRVRSNNGLPGFFPLFAMFLFYRVGTMTTFWFVGRSPFLRLSRRFPFLATMLLPTIVPLGFRFHSSYPFPSTGMGVVCLPTGSVMRYRYDEGFFTPFLPSESVRYIMEVVLSIGLVVAGRVALC